MFQCPGIDYKVLHEKWRQTKQSTARERERETETDRESCKSLDGLYYKPFSTWQVHALNTHAQVSMFYGDIP